MDKDKETVVSTMEEVKAALRAKGLINPELVDKEVDWFFNRLGIEVWYFMSYTPETISNHIQSIYGAKMLSMASGGDLTIDIRQESEEGAIYMCNSIPGSQQSPAMAIESRIGKMYLSVREDDDYSYRMQVYRSSGTISPDSKSQLRIYVVSRAKKTKVPIETGFSLNLSNSELESSIEEVGDDAFLANTSDNTKRLYQELLNKAVHSLGPIIKVVTPMDPNERRLIVCYKRGTTDRFFAGLSHLYHYHKFTTRRKYIEQFANGYVIVSLYLVPSDGNTKAIDSRVKKLKEEVNLMYILPFSEVEPLLVSGDLSLLESVYAYAAWKFAVQFLNRCGSEYYALQAALDTKNNQEHAALMSALKRRLINDTFTEANVLEIITESKEMIRMLYEDFAGKHMPPHGMGESESAVATRRTPAELLSQIKRLSSTEHQQSIFEMLLKFNQHVLKTNFYKLGKIAISFRLDSAFLAAEEYQEKPFGIFFVIGNEFRGFHVRFRDIARGGIRIIASQNSDAYARNTKVLFDECYGLASTQQQKNKDIPEGGSKGVILMNKNEISPHRRVSAFQKYADSILDLLLCANDEEIVDRYGKEEILFFGPDEGTAHMMDWASQHAKKRGASFWKAFTTGKSPNFGGIPHDTYGMTTRSIHQYVVGILNKLGLDETQITKLQTGGPDGDLGSNEIKISKDKTIAIVDGSGVLFDENGIDREELLRLANARVMARDFDKSKLSARGFFVDVNDREVRLPALGAAGQAEEGLFVESGLAFRNEFHLLPLSTATLFVPCGGRPAAVDISNVNKLFVDPTSSVKTRVPRFKYVVEGANLFFTQEARHVLEEAGVVIFRDASANKGGVTSSSLEVFAALALDDDEFMKLMAVTDPDNIPDFYKTYVQQVQQVIEANAAMEFECIWNAHQETKIPRSVLTNMLSSKINAITDQIASSDVLWSNESFRRIILEEAIPPILLQTIGLEQLLRRVPGKYMRAIFSTYLASHYVYTRGLNTVDFDFFMFVQPYLARGLALSSQ